MADEFRYDVFLSHGSKDKEVAREIAGRLRDDGLRVWFEEWELKPGDNILSRIEEGLEQSRVLVLCMSANAFGSDWARLEAGTFRFRDPLNKERRFIPLWLDEIPASGPLAEFPSVHWQTRDAYGRLLEACRTAIAPTPDAADIQAAERVIQLDHQGARVWTYAFSPDGEQALTGAADSLVRLWDLETGHCLRALNGHSAEIRSVALCPGSRYALSGSADGTARMWDLETDRCLQVLAGNTNQVWSIACNTDGSRALTGAADGLVRLWDLETGQCMCTLEGHDDLVTSLAFDADGNRAISTSGDKTLRLWDLQRGHCIRTLTGHTSVVFSAAWSGPRYALSGADDLAVRLWDLETGRCLHVLHGHTGPVWSVACSDDGKLAVSCSIDQTIRLWDLEARRCLRVLKGHRDFVFTVAWEANGRRAFSGDRGGSIRVWDLKEVVGDIPFAPAPNQVQYTNAKVLLVGDGSAGKTGLSMRLANSTWEPSDSTVGAWATQWKLPVSAPGAEVEGVEREIWLWDFGGQADQRLIHQLYMDDTALAVLVFDGQKEDLFESLGQWDRALTRAASPDLVKLLVAGRIDHGGLRDASRAGVQAFAKEHGYAGYLETSAKKNIGCEQLRRAILDGIRWHTIPPSTSPLLFKQLKEEIVRLRDQGRVLMRFSELRDALQLRLLNRNGDRVPRFHDDDLATVIRLLEGPAVVWELGFGSWVLLQPEVINAYAQAMIGTMRADVRDIGCLPEEQVLSGDLIYHSSMERLENKEDERFVLLAMDQTLVERGLCLREHTDRGTLLIFPSFYRRERPELVDHPSVLVSYQFGGFLDDIYTTLVVRLLHTKTFDRDHLWRYAADFKTPTGKQMGVKLTRRAEGAGKLEIYFDPEIGVEEKIVFSRYIHEHLVRKGKDVERQRHYVCPYCGTPVRNREVAMERLEEWLEQRPADTGLAQHRKSWIGKEAKPPTILCARCEQPVTLWDELEQCFASRDILQRVRELEEQAEDKLDSESKERALVGEVMSTVALAGQICREFAVSDQGIDMEIEFRKDIPRGSDRKVGVASGQRVYLQLKSGDSYLRKRKRDNAEIFRIPKPHHAQYWMEHPSPVLLVIRTSDGEIRWMDVRDWLRKATDGGKKQVRQIVFEGERFDVMSVRRWRDRVLRGN